MKSGDKAVEGQLEGIPYRGPVLHLKDTDDLEQMLKLNQKLRVEQFDLTDEGQRRGYTEVCQKINDGHAQLSFEDIRYDEAGRGWRVLLRWIEWWYSLREEPAAEQAGEERH